MNLCGKLNNAELTTVRAVFPHTVPIKNIYNIKDKEREIFCTSVKMFVF